MKPRPASVVPLHRWSLLAPVVAVAGALALVLGLALGAAPPAGAAPAAPTHSGGGTITVESAHPAEQSVHYIVRLTWDNDGHPADDATVTATPVAADGTSQTPVTLTGSGDGRYEGAVEFPEPGDWTVRFTSIDPTGSLDHPEAVQAPATTTTTAADEAAPSTTAGGFAPADDDTGASQDAPADAAAAEGGDDGDDGGIPLLLVLAAAVVAIGGVVTAIMAARRYRPADDAGDGDTGGDTAGAGAGASSSSSPGSEGTPGDDAR